MSNRSCDNKRPSFTENDIPDLTGYVTIVTGVAIRNTRIYIARRSEQRVNQTIRDIQQSVPGQRLDLRFLELDLHDLSSAKATAKAFSMLEDRLDLLIHNAGVGNPPLVL